MTVLRVYGRRVLLVFGLLVVGVAAAGALLQAGFARAETPATAPLAGLAGLRQQRIDTLRQASDMARQMYEQGLQTLGDVQRIDRMLLEAQLDAAATDKARAEILGKALAVAKQQEALVSDQLRAGAATPLAALEATAERLKVEAQWTELAAK